MRRIAAGTLGLMIAIAGGRGLLLAGPPDEPAGTASEAVARLSASAENRTSSVAARVEPNTYGPSVETALTVGGSAFKEIVPNQTILEDGTGSAYFSGTGTNSVAWAPVSLPQGAQITGMDFYYVDYDVTTNLTAILNELSFAGPYFNYVAGLNSSGSGGFGASGMNLGSPWTVNNNLNAYAIYLVSLASPASDLRWRGVKIRYKLQVSPAPGFATFSDVPTGHPYFQFIEALKASGITAGCGNGTNYCPGDPVTRGQMAVFLARALGLQWN